MRNQPIGRAFGFHLLGGLAERQRFGLREDVGHQDVVMPADAVSAGCAKAMKSQGMRRVPW